MDQDRVSRHATANDAIVQYGTIITSQSGLWLRTGQSKATG